MAKSLLDTYVHEQTIICRQLFIGHMVGSGPMKKEGKNEVNDDKIIVISFLICCCCY